ncbi:hypothetical protein PPERSA_05602 [Pseudocohnilembus persalinus]|uniref:Transmembrane protein n=1 Tax=Pseudocohnilembus persalinus TaxID=266149 RepID=A0A0V0QDY7_PSEPJ|nr:hypothetical protein PPERSA_05602 [Pseudocohnilembus persalinus]|eukprot:KRX00425.1 hypothetical protein PPERSA_05602 [Pseudocohnilembus persalinus]
MNRKFKRFIKTSVLPFIYSTTLVGGGVLGYFSIKVQKNRKQFEEEQEHDEFYKDTTRDQNLYYGINWGFRADQLIADKIDAGDILFIKFDCDECLQLKDILNCNTLQLFNSDQDYDSIGFAFRDKNGVYIICSQFGKTQIMEYHEFLAQPFLKELSMRKIILKGERNQRTFYKTVKNHFKNLQNKIESEGYIKEPAENMAYNYMKSLGFIKTEFLEDTQINNYQPYLNSYDSDAPFFLQKIMKLDSKVIIRSNTNKQLRARQ